MIVAIVVAGVIVIYSVEWLYSSWWRVGKVVHVKGYTEKDNREAEVWWNK